MHQNWENSLATICIYKCLKCRKYSYLAVVSGVISEADYIFIPESPPPSDWPQRLCDKLIQASFQCLFNKQIKNKNKQTFSFYMYAVYGNLFKHHFSTD